MTTVELKQAKNQLNELWEAGLEGEEIIITENNEPVVKLSPVKLAKKPPLQQIVMYFFGMSLIINNGETTIKL